MRQAVRIDKTGIDRKLWEYPWNYAESFIIVNIVLVIGIITELVCGGKTISIPRLPMNLFIILLFTAILLFVYLKYRESPIIIWISGVPAAISAIITYSVLVLLLGFIPQSTEVTPKFLSITGLSHVKNSFPFLFIEFFLLTSLGLVILKKSIPFKVKNIGFLLNHFGLWLTLVAAGIGSSDLKRLSFNLFENRSPTNIAVSQSGINYLMPFSLKLLDFNIVQYHPYLTVINSETKKYNIGKSNSLPVAAKGIETEIADYQIKVLDYKSNVLFKEGIPIATNQVGSSPAAYVFVKNKLSGDTIRGWISYGILGIKPNYLYLNKIDVLMLTQPEPKKYCSRLLVLEDLNKSDTVTLEVNKPYAIKGWDMYQIGYNQFRDKGLTLSIIEAVRDPWLPVVYAGMALIFAGSVYLFLKGKNIKEITF